MIIFEVYKHYEKNFGTQIGTRLVVTLKQSLTQ